MLEEAIKLIAVNRDAIATNRGFYFQYLKLLERWIENFVSDSSGTLYSEVGDDMKEINGALIFTQFKCYTSTFSLNSREIKTAILAFYAQFLAHKSDFPIRFEFVTNTSVGKNEKLLREWIQLLPLKDDEFRAKCERRISGILQDEIKRCLNGRLAKRNGLIIRDVLTERYNVLTDSIPENIHGFIGSINWSFSDLQPEEAIRQILSKLKLLLSDTKFAGKSPSLLLDVLLSEIYRKSQNANDEDRKLDNQLLFTILEKTDEQLKDSVEAKVSAFFRSEIATLSSEIEHIKLVQEIHEERLEGLEKSLKAGKDFPKEITLIPFLDSNRMVERQEMLTAIGDHFKSANHLNICGAGGMGKSTLAKMYLHQHYSEFDHIIWIDAKQGIIPSVLGNEDIVINLDLVKTEKDLIFNTFLNKLNQLKGTNLIILDNLKADKAVFLQLASLKNWYVISTSRYKNENCHNLSLSNFNFRQAKELFSKYCDHQVDDTCFLEFVEFIQYNTLMLELAAKTIANSIDLKLNKLLTYLKNQQLDDIDLAIDIEYEGAIDQTQIFSSLLATFELSDLSKEEVALLEFFSILPSEEIAIVDLIDMAGESSKKENRQFFINNINRLAQKGWIEKAGDKFSMHRLVQQSIIYNIRKTKSFGTSVFPIIWLTARFSEAHKNNPAAALRFLKYGESILDAIKEPFRNEMYQPLLILENEVLLVYTMFMTEIDVLDKWRDLTRRASDYLKDGDPLLGSILGNFGMALMRDGKIEEAESCYFKACELFKDDERLIGHLISSKINLSVVYTAQRDFEKVKAIMKEISDIRRQNNRGNDSSAFLEGNALAHANKVAGNLKGAEEIYQLLRDVYFEMPLDQRNIAHYAEVMFNYSVVLIEQNKHELAIDNQLRTILHLEDNKIGDSVTVFRRNINLLYTLYLNNNLEVEAKALKQKYGHRS